MSQLVVLVWCLLVGYQNDSPLDEFIKLNKEYDIRKKNMYLSMNMEVKAECGSSESQKQSIKYYYLGNSMYVNSGYWEVIYTNNQYVFIDHVNKVIMISPNAAESLEKVNGLSNFENIQSLLTEESESKLTKDINGNKLIQILPKYGDYYKIDVEVNSKTQIKELSLTARTSQQGGPYEVKKPYCVRIRFEKEEYGVVRKDQFQLSKFVIKTFDGYKLTQEFKDYKLVS